MAIDIQGMAPLLQVFDMPTAIRFYRDILNFEVAGKSGPGEDVDWALLRRNDIQLMLNTAYESHERPPAPDPARVAAHDDAALYFSCPNLDEAYAHLRTHGLDVKPPETRPYGMRQVYVSDPDGYNLCFQWPAAE